MPVLRIACDGSTTLPLEQLAEFQGDLKSLSKENFKKLRRSITRRGYSFPICVWQAPSGENYILDGHQRLRVLRVLRGEGWEIPELPVVTVEAESLKDARQRLLAAASQYGTVEGQGLYELLLESDLDVEAMLEDTRFPEVDTDDFRREFFDEIEPQRETGEKEASAPASKTSEVWQLGAHRLVCGQEDREQALALVAYWEQMTGCEAIPES